MIDYRKIPLVSKEKGTTTIVVSGGIAILRLFMNIDWSKVDLSRPLHNPTIHG